MKKLLMCFAVLLLMLIACKGRRSASSDDLNTVAEAQDSIKNGTEIYSCIDSVLYKEIRSYMITYLDSPDANYYSVYFFRKDSADYFTIWNIFMLPKKSMEMDNPGISFNYYWFQIDRKDVILITREDDTRPLPFKSCVNQLDTMSIEDLPEKKFVAANIFAFRTYRYYLEDGRYHIEPLRDTIYMDFKKMGTANEMRILRKENRIERQQLKME